MYYTVRVTNHHSLVVFPESFLTLREASERGKWYRSNRAESHSYEIIDPSGDVLERYSYSYGLRRNYAG